MDISIQPVVIDNGSENIRAGFAGDDAPRISIPNVFGEFRRPCIMIGQEQKEYYIANEAIMRLGVLNINYPVKRGIIQNFDQITKIFHYVFNNHLKVQPEDQPCLISESNLLKQHSQNHLRTKKNYSKFYLKISKFPKFNLPSSGRTTGLILQMGSGNSSVIPVVEGQLIEPNVHQMNIGGHDITKYIQNQSNRFLINHKNIKLIQNIKEKCCYINNGKIYETLYQMPDGSQIKIMDEAHKSTEILFDPSIIGKESNGIHEILSDTLKKTDMRQKNLLQENIILTGGTSCIQGLEQRLYDEMKHLGFDENKLKISAPSDRILATWTGGSLLSSLNTYQQSWITKKDYQEIGENYIYRLQQ